MNTTETTVIRVPARLARTRLERNALAWLNENYGYNNGATGRYADLEHGGCQDGTVGHLIYSADCRAFLKRHRQEINDLLGAMLEGMGLSGPKDLLREWDDCDPLGENVNADRLAWFGFETACRNLMERAQAEASQ